VTVLALAAGTAYARGQLQTRQTGIELVPGDRAGRLVLANSGDATVAAQVRVFAWTQRDGEDQLEPSNGLIASPAIVEIPAGGEQLVRVVRADGAPVTREQAYRVVVDELPGDPSTEAGSAVTVRMRYLIPAFVRATDPAPVQLTCRIEAAALSCDNAGGRAAQIGATAWRTPQGQSVPLSNGLLGYVLAGSHRRFPLTSTSLPAVTGGTLELQLNGQSARLPLSPAP
jgi:fimbrial chaperone protein